MPCLAASSGVKRSVIRRRRAISTAGDGLVGVVGPAVGEDGGGAHQASTSVTAPGAPWLGEPEERLAVAGRALQRGRRAAEDRGRDRVGDRLDRLLPQLRVAHDAALADAGLADLELRLDHREAVERRRRRTPGPRAGPWSAR